MKHISQAATYQHKQRGVVLIITMIMLVIMTLGAIALVRSIDTTNLIAGNLAFKQSATLSGELGLEAATTWLEANRTSLNANVAADGYFASWGTTTGPGGQDWQSYWNTLGQSKTLPIDAAGNSAAYLIQRMCPTVGILNNGPAAAGCVYTRSTACGGNSKTAGSASITYCYVTHYRITVRIVGPRNTVSFIQAVVAL